MSEYTPTTDEIREYIETGGEPRPWVELDEAEKAREKARVAAFDRWLAAHDAQKDATIAELRLELAKQEDRLALARFDTDELHRIRAGVEAEEPEWGIANAKTPDKVWPLSEEGARETAAAEPGQWIIYSRPKTVVHEWVPVKQEGTEP